MKGGERDAGGERNIVVMGCGGVVRRE